MIGSEGLSDQLIPCSNASPAAPMSLAWLSPLLTYQTWSPYTLTLRHRACRHMISNRLPNSLSERLIQIKIRPASSTGHMMKDSLQQLSQGSSQLLQSRKRCTLSKTTLHSSQTTGTDGQSSMTWDQ